MKRLFLIISFILLIPASASAGIITDAPRLSEVLLNILDFLLSMFGVLAILALGLSGSLYLISGGDEKRAEMVKKWATFSMIGISIALGALVIVRQLAAFFN